MFIISEEYERSDLLSYVGSGHHYSGIIYGSKDETCVIVTSGGESGKSVGYHDRWEPDGSFTYIGQGQKGDQDPEGAGNSKLVLGQRSVLLFTTEEPTAEQRKQRRSRRKLYKFEGIFEVKHWDMITVKEGDRANDKLIEFSLVRAENIYNPSSVVPARGSIIVKETNFWDLRNRVKNQDAKPRKGNMSPREYFRRSDDVVQYAIIRAKGVCEYCSKPGPFEDVAGNLFLEVHHIFRLSDGGPDAKENVAAICPNCHREAHFGKKRHIIRDELSDIVQKIEYLLDNP